MVVQDKVGIFDILDMFNKEVGYRGLDNTNKKTDERDDVISRQTFNNWLSEYNATHSRPIKSEKVDQYHNEWFKSDIEKLIQDKKVQKRLRDAYLRNTVALFEGFESMGFVSSQRVSKKYNEVQSELHKNGNSEALMQSLEIMIDKLIDEVIDNHFALLFKGEQIDGKRYINRREIIDGFIDKEKLEEEAFKIIDNYYGIPEYDESGNIVHLHNYETRKETKYLLRK